MFQTLYLMKILAGVLISVAVIFFISYSFHKRYRRVSSAWRMTTIFLIHSLNCLILMAGFFASEQLHDAYVQSNYWLTEIILYSATFSLIFLLGLPFIFFYVRSQAALSKLLEERVSHKLDIINFMKRVMDLLPNDSRDHGTETGLLVKNFCRHLKIKSELSQDVVFAALFHNVGEAFIKNEAALVHKGTDRDYRVNLGASLFNRITIYKTTAEIIQHQQEKWNGTGKPNELRGVDIPLGSRIIAIAAAYDRFVNGRNNQPKLSSQEALAKLNESRGIDFDPELLDQFQTYILSLN